MEGCRREVHVMEGSCCLYTLEELLQRDVEACQRRRAQRMGLCVDARDLKAVLAAHKYGDRLCVGVYDPVLLDSVLGIEVELDRPVALGGGW